MADINGVISEAEEKLSWLAPDEIEKNHIGIMVTTGFLKDVIELLKENKALRLLVDWAVECDFGYDNFDDEYQRYKDEIDDNATYTEGMIKIAQCVIRRIERVGHA